MRRSGVAGSLVIAVLATIAVAAPSTVATAAPGDTTIEVTVRAQSTSAILTDGCVRLRETTSGDVVEENCTPVGDSYVFTVDPVAIAYDAQSLGFEGFLDDESATPVTAVVGESRPLEVLAGDPFVIRTYVRPPVGSASTTSVCASAVDSNAEDVATTCGIRGGAGYATLDLEVPPGFYRIKYFAEAGDAAVGWWGGTYFGSAREYEVKSAGNNVPTGTAFQLVVGATISGTLLDAAGNAMDGQCVRLSSTVPAFVDSACADVNGLWSIGELPAGEYMIFVPADEGAVGQWVGGASVATAQRWTVPQGGSVTADAQLVELATIEGDVTGPSGAAAADGCVAAYLMPDLRYVGYACAEPGGHFSLDVFPGDYVLRYEGWTDDAAEALPDVWRGGVASWHEATPITVASGSPTDASIQLASAGALVTVNPRVTLGGSAEPAPATGGCVDAVSVDGWYVGTECDLGSGTVSFSLPPGDYALYGAGFVYDEASEHEKYGRNLGSTWAADSWNSGSLFFDEADWVTVPSSGATTETLSLLPGQRLEGTARAMTGQYTSQIVTAGTMIAYDADSGIEVSWAAIHPDGRYSFSPMPLAQNVRLAVDDAPDVPFQFVNSAGLYRPLLFDEATVWNVGLAGFGNTTVSTGGTIAGRLNVPLHFADGEVCADLWYADSNPDDAIYLDSRCGERHSDFEFAGLPKGSYFISFSDSEGYGEWYSDSNGGDYREPYQEPMRLTLEPGGHLDVRRLTAEPSPTPPYVYGGPVTVTLTMWPPITETIPSFTFRGRNGASQTSEEDIVFVDGRAEVTFQPVVGRDHQVRFNYTSGSGSPSILSNYFKLDTYLPGLTIDPVAPALPGQTVHLSLTVEVPYTGLAGILFREPGGPWTLYYSTEIVDGTGTYSVVAKSYPVEYRFNALGSDSNIVIVGPSAPHVERIGGDTRYDVAAGIGTKYFPDGADTVYIATGANFPDALGAAPAAALRDAPLLLVEPNNIPYAVMFELERLAPDRIIVTGGPASVSDAVLAQLGNYASIVERITGPDRYEVSRRVTRDAFEDVGSDIAYIATGATFPDALSASAAAGSVQAPVILLYGKAPTLDSATSQLLVDLGVKEVRIAGGPASVSPGIETALRNLPGITTVSRLTGADRFVVSGATNRAAFTASDTVFIASGYTFPDALAGAPVAGILGAPLYVIPTTCIPSYVLEDITNLGATKVQIFGGPASVTPAAAALARC